MMLKCQYVPWFFLLFTLIETGPTRETTKGVKGTVWRQSCSCRPSPPRTKDAGRHTAPRSPVPSEPQNFTSFPTTWIANCDRLFPSTLPQKPATVTQKSGNLAI